MLGAGCSGEDPQQRAARESAERHVLALDGYTGEAHCTDSARSGWFARRFTEDYLCAAQLEDGNCDWFLVRFDERRRVTVALDRRAAGCTFPF